MTGSKAAPMGRLEADSVRVLSGISGSVDAIAKVRSTPSSTERDEGTVSDGGLLTSLTEMVSVCVLVSEPSETTIAIAIVAGPWASVGVQVKTPAEVIAAPEGAPGPNVNVKVFAGMSASVAVAVKVRRVCSFTVLSPTGLRVGDRFASLTVTTIVSESNLAGEPLSVTVMVTEYRPGPCDSEGVQLNTPVTGSIVEPAGAPEPNE